MHKLGMIGLALWLGLAGCGDSGDDGSAGTSGAGTGAGAGGGGTMAGMGGGGTSAGTSAGGTGGGATCDPASAMMGSGDPACQDCISTMCSDELAMCYGAGWASGTIGGVCETFLDCICACPSGDAACPVNCFTSASAECTSCLTTSGLCTATSCATACSGMM